MKIVRFVAENIKRLKAVELELNGTAGLVEVRGANGVGKSSVLDAIWWAMAGARTHDAEPIRRGEDEARIELDLGALVVRRRFRRVDDKRVTTSLTVESEDGARYPSPQAVLDRLLGTLAFDPLQFVQADDQGRIKMLTEIAGHDLESSMRRERHERERARARDRVARGLRAQADAIEIPPAPDRDVAVLDEQIESLRHGLRRAEAARGQRDVWSLHMRDLDKQQAKLKQSLAIARSTIARVERDLPRVEEALRQGLDVEPDVPDIDVFLDEINALVDVRAACVRAESERVDRESRKAQYLKEEAEAKAEADSARKEITAIKAARQAAVTAARLPEGLTISGDTIRYGDLPFEQASSAEALQVSCLVAMRQAPELRVLRVREGPLLDECAMDRLRKWAIEHDFQIWIERIESGGPMRVCIDAAGCE